MNKENPSHICFRETKHRDLSNSGFTLIEMLIVIAIISILASMLLPELRSSLDAVRQLSCSNNLRQIGIAQSGYSNDYDGWIIPSLQEYYTPNPSGYFFSVLAGTYKTPAGTDYGVQYKDWRGLNELGAFRCPSEETPGGNSTDNPPKFGFTHYGINNRLAGNILANGESHAVWKIHKTNAMNSPSTVVLIADNNNRASPGLPGGIYEMSFRHGANDPRSVDTVAGAREELPAVLFKGKSNVLFGDGHVQPLSVDQSLVQGSKYILLTRGFTY